MAHAEWKELGIPDGYGPFRLLYNPPTETVIAELRKLREDTGPHRRIYIRQREAQEYRQVGNPEPDLSCESVVTCSTQPILFFNAMRITRHERVFKGNWEAVYSFDLSSYALAVCLDRSNISLPSPFSDCWVSDLIGHSEAENALYLTIGLRGDRQQGIRYSLARVELSTRVVQPISWLRAAFF